MCILLIFHILPRNTLYIVHAGWFFRLHQSLHLLLLSFSLDLSTSESISISFLFVLYFHSILYLVCKQFSYSIWWVRNECKFQLISYAESIWTDRRKKEKNETTFDWLRSYWSHRSNMKSNCIYQKQPEQTSFPRLRMDLSDFDYRENGWFRNVRKISKHQKFKVIVPNGCENYLSVDVKNMLVI